MQYCFMSSVLCLRFQVLDFLCLGIKKTVALRRDAVATLIYRDSAAPRVSALGRRLFLASRGKRRVLIRLKGN